MLEEMVDFPNVDAIAGTTLSQQDIYWTGSDKDNAYESLRLCYRTSLNTADFRLHN